MRPTELDRREWFRERWAHGIPFNRHCGIEVRRWDDEAVELFLPYADAVMAGHDFAKGSRLTTISLSVHYLSVAPGEDLLATGRCTRRGRSVHFAQAQACGAVSGKVVATGQVAVSIAGERPGMSWPDGTG